MEPKIAQKVPVAVELEGWQPGQSGDRASADGASTDRPVPRAQPLAGPEQRPLALLPFPEVSGQETDMRSMRSGCISDFR
jgi:hypothetical protein